MKNRKISNRAFNDPFTIQIAPMLSWNSRLDRTCSTCRSPDLLRILRLSHNGHHWTQIGMYHHDIPSGFLLDRFSGNRLSDLTQTTYPSSPIVSFDLHLRRDHGDGRLRRAHRPCLPGRAWGATSCARVYASAAGRRAPSPGESARVPAASITMRTVPAAGRSGGEGPVRGL